MRPSSVVQSGMPTGPKWIGWWGAFGGPVQKGIKSYAVSPFQQNPFAGVFQGYMFNGFRRAVKHLPYSGIPFALGYLIYTWGNKESAYVNSKAGHLAHGGEH
ncbi:Similar to S.cerevisiae protein QCR8 (Subunit 8 of ubiquinol cytochrome-c reductase (Complex III)) [Malassezia sympodialis ATCC 42132]|uniref:Cytochrome b-c1 complex subunit 8 n=1 Tax=Malassezia sympodialis (strain ATCC 42132) TaxID=1230383 RepID=A0A1M8A4R2_MALS4|nr:Similar to S.cerevisiae protein QCR8 (Subunit 8 of ubiquinol cytochrome-c reductase (Complex III)) [Malassezia sympodialis ATCC 42132]